MSKRSCEGLDELARCTAMQLSRASLAEAALADHPEQSRDLMQAAAIHQARAEGIRTAAEMLLPPEALQQFQSLVEATLSEEEVQFTRELVESLETSSSAGPGVLEHANG